jgi:hypothetical protein
MAQEIQRGFQYPIQSGKLSKSVTAIGGSMKLSMFNSFLAFFRKKAGLEGAGSRGFLAFNLFLAICLVSASIVFAVNFTRRQVSAYGPIANEGTDIITAPVRFTRSQSPISLYQLLMMNGQITQLDAAKRVASIRVLVEAGSNHLIFTKLGMPQPPGHTFDVCYEEDRIIDLPEQNIPAQEILNQYLVYSEDFCNALIVIKFK